MTLRRVKVVMLSSGAWGVELPQYEMVPGSFLPIEKDLIDADGIAPKADPVAVSAHGVTVLVRVPDDEIDAHTAELSPARIAAKYAGHAKWGDADAVSTLIADKVSVARAEGAGQAG